MRITEIDLEEMTAGEEAEAVTVGLNWYLNQNSRIMFNLTNTSWAKPLPMAMTSPVSSPFRCDFLIKIVDSGRFQFATKSTVGILPTTQ